MSSKIMGMIVAVSICTALLAGHVSASTTAHAVKPAEAAKALLEGNARFVAGKSVHPNTSAARMVETTKGGQHPFATIITCSDSRVPVERVFDQGIGDVFVIRVAGNVCDTDEIGSIEYGVDHLSTPIFVVLGHKNCGAVTAVVTKAKLHGSIPPLVDNIIPAVKKTQAKHPNLHGKALVPEAIKGNVWQSIDDLMTHSPATRKRVKEGKLVVIGAVYDIETGKVNWMGAHPEQGKLLAKTSGPKVAHGAPKAHAEPRPKTPDQAVATLTRGNARFVKGHSSHPNTDAARRIKTARYGQHPFATVITCADSRVPVGRVFDQGIGDVFVIREAGNVCDTDEIGSIEYGIDHLATPVFVVMGHSQCGAVTAVATNAELHGSIPPLVDNIKPAVARAQHNHPNVHGKAIVPYAIKENVWQSIDDLFRRSPAARKRVQAGTLKVVGAVYNIESGKVEWMGVHPQLKRLLAYTGGGHATDGDAHAKAADTHGAPATGGDSHGAAAGGHGEEIKAEAITLLASSRIAELNNARHAKIVDHEVDISDVAEGSSMWIVIGILAAITLTGGFAWQSGFFGRLGVAGKLGVGFTAVVLIAIATGICGYYYLGVVNHDSHIASAALELDLMAAEMGKLQSDFCLLGISDKELGEEILKEHKAISDEYIGDFKILRAFGLTAEEEKVVAGLEKNAHAYDEIFGELTEKYHDIEVLKEELDELGKEVEEQLAHILHEHEQDLAKLQAKGASAQDMAVQIALIEAAAECEILALKLSHEEVEFLLDKRISRIGTMEKELGLLKPSIEHLRGLVSKAATSSEEEKADLKILALLEKELDSYQEKLTEVIEDELIVAADFVACNQLIHDIEAGGAALAHHAEAEAKVAQASANTMSIAFIVIAAVVGTLLAVVITRSITGPLKRVIIGLNSGADQVATASGQMSSSSQSLASGCSEQAASIEETSASLEEMSSMTKQNAGNSQEANTIMTDASETVGRTQGSMERLNSAIEEIKNSADETSRIIKTIDEIAFQTNLLALNAAVEAARAGDAGKGFAVVAEEVRNLAQRAGEAARTTGELIEGSVKNAENGVTAAQETGETLNEVSGQATRAASIVGEIAAASNEQSQGVDQINVAVSQMDTVVQSNAASAEETAAAAEELTSQAGELHQMVAELSRVVGVSAQERRQALGGAPAPARPAAAPRTAMVASQAPVAHGNGAEVDEETLARF
jgi:methyl-accepting chemotaxis protein